MSGTIKTPCQVIENGTAGFVKIEGYSLGKVPGAGVSVDWKRVATSADATDFATLPEAVREYFSSGDWEDENTSFFILPPP